MNDCPGTSHTVSEDNKLYPHSSNKEQRDSGCTGKANNNLGISFIEAPSFFMFIYTINHSSS